MSNLHPAAPAHLPSFIAAPDGSDHMMAAMTVFLILAVLGVGILFLRLHTLPERMAHRSKKLQLEIVAALGLLALFTHIHLFWVAGLLLALVDIPDFGTPLKRMAKALETLAGLPIEPEPEDVAAHRVPDQDAHPGDGDGRKGSAHA